MRKNLKYLLPCLLFPAFANHGSSQIKIGETDADTMTVVSGLDTPWEILWGPDNHIWITERYGRISRLEPLSGEINEVALIGEVHEQGEAGLLGMALHPDFTNTPHLFIVYNYLESSSIKERLVRYTYDNGLLSEPVTLLEGIPGASNHNGSRIFIDPDRKLFMTTGDAANTSTSQDLGSLNGKVLRMNLDGTIPDDNPIPGSLIWSWGHRNAQGLVLAPSGILYSAEHGPSSDDEVNIIEKGRNYGWPNVKGFCDGATETQFCSDSAVVEPIAAWTPTLAVSGADYYGSPAIPQWNNSVLVTSLKASRLVVLNLNEHGTSVVGETHHFQDWFGRLRDLCVSPAGDLYLAVSNRDGRGTVREGDDRIVKISAQQTTHYCIREMEETVCPGESIRFNGREISTPGTYVDTIPSEHGCDSILSMTLHHYETGEIGLEESYSVAVNDSVTLQANPGFVSYSWNGQTQTSENSYTIPGKNLGEGSHPITIRVEDLNGCFLTDTVLLSVTGVTAIQPVSGNPMKIYPNPVEGNELTIDYAPNVPALLSIYDQQGSLRVKRILPPGRSTTTVTLPDADGLYLIRITEGSKTMSNVVMKF